MKKFLFILSLLLNSFIVFAQEIAQGYIVLQDKNETVVIGREVSYLEDEDGKLTIEQINSPEYQAKLMVSDKATLNFGLTTDSFYWIKIIIQNNTVEKEWVLELASPLFEIADWYMENNGDWELQKDGFLVPKEERSLQNPMLVVSQQKQNLLKRKQ